MAGSRSCAPKEQRQRERQLQRDRTERRRRLFDENIDNNKIGSGYWDFGRMDVQCSECGASQLMAERLKHSSRDDPAFADCCKNGKVLFRPVIDPPQYFQGLRTHRGSRVGHFRKNIRIFYNAM